MSHKHEEKSWESSQSESCEQMPMYPMQNCNPCMQCPMMYGGMNMQGDPMMHKCMKGSSMMPKYGREEDDDRYYYGHPYYHPYYHYYWHPHYHHYRDREE